MTISRVLKGNLKLKSRKPYKTFKINKKREKTHCEWAVEIKKTQGGKTSNYGKMDLSHIWFSSAKEESLNLLRR